MYNRPNTTKVKLLSWRRVPMHAVKNAGFMYAVRMVGLKCVPMYAVR